MLQLRINVSCGKMLNSALYNYIALRIQYTRLFILHRTSQASADWCCWIITIFLSELVSSDNFVWFHNFVKSQPNIQTLSFTYLPYAYDSRAKGISNWEKKTWRYRIHTENMWTTWMDNFFIIFIEIFYCDMIE